MGGVAYWILLSLILGHAYCGKEYDKRVLKPLNSSLGRIFLINTTMGRGELIHRLYHIIGCPDEELSLSCPSPEEMIIIENSTFSPSVNCLKAKRNFKFGSLIPLRRDPSGLYDRKNNYSYTTNLGRTDLRQALNRRCSGFGNGKVCTFNLRLDHPESLSWKQRGFVEIYFRCAERVHGAECSAASKDTRKRTGVIKAGAVGFLRSLEYPKYYTGGRSCDWSLRAEPGQRIFLRFLDINLREKKGGECLDYVIVYERGKMLLKLCGESETDIMLLSQSHTLDIFLQTGGRSIYPRRGVLAEYWPVGCDQNPKEGLSYISYRNSSHVTYSCPKGTGLGDNRAPSVTVICNGKEWSKEINTCYKFPIESGFRTNSEMSSEREVNSSNLTAGNYFSVIFFICLMFVFIAALSVGALLVVGHSDFIATRSLLNGGRRRRRSPIINPVTQLNEEYGTEDITALTPGSLRGFDGNNSNVSTLEIPHQRASMASVSEVTLHLHEGLDLMRLKREELYLC